MKIGIVIGSVRDQRNGEQVANWVYDYTKSNPIDGVEFEIIDLKKYDLPLLGITPTAEQEEAIKGWSNVMGKVDGYIFVAPEYNRSLGGAFKNGLDYLKPEVANKAVGFVGYGGLGGSFAIASMRPIVAELRMASVRTMVSFSLITDFENFSKFNPASYHETNVSEMIKEVVLWTKALSTIR